MKIYLVSLGAGLLVGVIYSLLQVRSPAPPLVALVGLLGILAGEQVLPLGKQLMRGAGIRIAIDDFGKGSRLFARRIKYPEVVIAEANCNWTLWETTA